MRVRVRVQVLYGHQEDVRGPRGALAMATSLNDDDITVIHPMDTDIRKDDPNVGPADDDDWWDSGRRDNNVDDTD
ncbi:hypothetical protein [Actinoplanes siamensis]|uniref:Uncharacterized protein n=1 Tax=Actinoplanes siamensis TaxID=1223317 RepID=A0A919N652_9ACTN|nr:hypothetical protein [Actinoplanes siamensis]GIF05085.1 hypothetical protein Asi03nite_26230 [Actinoplanes siamensis]